VDCLLGAVRKRYRPGHAGIRNDDIDVAEAPDRFLHKSSQVVRPGYIAGNSENIVRRGGTDRLQSLPVTGKDSEAGPRSQVTIRDRSANSAAGTGDDGNFSLKCSRHCRFLLLSRYSYFGKSLREVIADDPNGDLTLVNRSDEYANERLVMLHGQELKVFPADPLSSGQMELPDSEGG
jgi:hypothetical protein